MNPNTYTSQYGTTVQGSQLAQANQNLQNIMSGPNVQAAQAMAPFSQAGPGYVQQQQQNLTQQAGIPQLQGQYNDLSKIFPLYLADQHLSQKYTSSQLSSPNSPIFNNPNLTPQPGIIPGDTSGTPNPYLASPQALVNAVTQPSGQGFQGFSTPGLNTSAMGQVPGAAGNIMNLLQSALGQEQGLVNSKTGDASANYQAFLSSLGTLANAYVADKAYASSGTAPGTSQQAGSLFNDIINQVQTVKGGDASERDIWDYINQHDAALRAQGVNVNELWRLHKDLAQKVGTNGKITGGTKAKSATLLKQDQTNKAEVDAAQSLLDTAKGIAKDMKAAGPMRVLPGAQHYVPAFASAKDKIFQSLGALRKSAVGGRITQAEIGWLTANTLPNEWDTPAVMDSKVQVLQDELNKKLNNGDYRIGSGGGSAPKTGGSSNDPLGIR